MRYAALSFSALMIAACGASGGDVKSPAAPEAAGEVVQKVFEICGTAMNKGAVIDALPLAAEDGWELQDGGGQSGIPLDIMRPTTLTKDGADARIHMQFFEHDGLHEKVVGCQFVRAFSEGDFALNPAVFDDMAGFEGRWTAVEDGLVGRWSKRNGNTVLSILVMQDGDKFSTLSMNKTTLK